ncbi:FadR/GntR family transcriptional regulator [Roseateles saccharophilus]|uniref:GntR family transcriptional regulator n=1 Tax=Roseateles saccharophilus TaxID=304 RepID=A0A4R3VIQ6_ROSSA|nr:FadR/GntR family transcriptional regulator [Roseateles saccharophilus]MDG0835459.1 FadR family transcriptional regulator [Roseateles saccharophilus]TCV04013.1 GntR family transcriptional regulator [Roseateles saccharophilus]
MSSHHRASESRRQYQLVADRIRALIEEEGIGAGSRLPAERELALQLGVSRPSLREALIALEIDGRIEIRGGSGVYVCAVPVGASDAATSTLGESPAELMQARVVLEGAVITLAAARVTKAGLQRVEDALAAMREEHASGRKPVDADRRFHLSIAEMAGNSVLVDMVGALFDGRHGPIAARMSGKVESTHTWEAAVGEHEAIYRALEARNPQAAAAAMCSHLLASHGRWVGEVADVATKAALSGA